MTEKKSKRQTYKRELRASITERGQITVPAEIRKLLGLEKKGQVSFIVENGVVTLRRPSLTWREVGGSIKPMNMPEDWEARIREAKEEKAERTIREMQTN
jgi:AbrB family looped-hinge helix DNA binding protein